MNSERTLVFPQHAGIATWLATVNIGFLEQLAACQPELLLVSPDAVQTLGADKLCSCILQRANSISHRQRHNESFYKNLFRLKGIKTTEILKYVLRNHKVDESLIALAIQIADECKCVELCDLLVELVLDTNLELIRK
jgi:hypothetical protein